LNLERVNYWIEKGAQPTDTVIRLIKASAKAEKAAAAVEA
jgi:ribosomal protein S16